MTLGKAVYSHVLIPSCTVLHQRTVTSLRTAAEKGIAVLPAGIPPRWQQTESALEPVDFSWCPARAPAEAVATLPR